MKVFANAFLILASVGMVFSTFAQSAEIRTNALTATNPPDWVDSARLERITAKIQDSLEWDIRRVTVIWYSDQAAFEKTHGFGPLVLAYSRPAENSVHVGPRVTSRDFDGVFGHELVHVIVYQKYKDAIPKWLEEGLANYVAVRDTVDYNWLSSRIAAEGDVRKLVHPFNGVSNDTGHAQYHYMASKALVEMIVAHCDLNNLLQLSVGKKLETYLDTFCGIPDVNASFKSWVDQKKGGPKPVSKKP